MRLDKLKKCAKTFMAVYFIVVLVLCVACYLTGNTYADSANIAYAEDTGSSSSTTTNSIVSIDISTLESKITSGKNISGQIKITYEHEYDADEKNERLDWKVDATFNGEGYIAVNITAYDTNGNATVTVTGSNVGNARVIFYGTTSGKTFATYDVEVENYQTWSDVVDSVLSSSTVLVLIFTVMATVISRTAIKIFRFGVAYKSEFATKDEQREFEASIRQELKDTKTETQDSILKICLREINRETAPLKDMQTIANEMKTDKSVLDERVKNMETKYNEIRKMSDNIVQLERKINAAQYSDSTSEIRRSGR